MKRNTHRNARFAVHPKFALPGLHGFVVVADDDVCTGELLQRASRIAQRLSANTIGDTDSFVLVFNGRSVRRRLSPHAHVYLPASRLAKALLHLGLGMRGLLNSMLSLAAGIRALATKTQLGLRNRSARGEP